MKPNPDYIKRLLAAFQDSPDPYVDISKIAAAGLPTNTPEFVFHIRLLNDQDFVQREDGKPGVGIEKVGDDYLLNTLPLRLTASGHEFAEAMNNNKAFETVKKSLVSSSIGIMKDIAVTVFKGELARHGIDLGH